MQEETISKIHNGHLGVRKCLPRARTYVWWPGFSSQIKAAIYNCSKCAQYSIPSKEPLISTPLPQHPWQVVGTDLFELHGSNYLLAVDCFSRFPELIKLTSTTSSAIIPALKSIFSRHGIPQTLQSDNGPQFDSKEMAVFATSYGFLHETSSPYFPQSNGQVERTVRTVKQLLKKSTDPHLSLLVYRSTPLYWCNYSPAELLMGRHILFTLPILTQHLKPDWSYQCSCQKFVSKVGGLLGSMWLMNITCCGQCVYTCAVYCNNNDRFYDCLLWRCHMIMLWLTINLLVGVTRTNCSLGGLYVIWMVKEGYNTVQGGKPP